MTYFVNKRVKVKEISQRVTKECHSVFIFRSEREQTFFQPNKVPREFTVCSLLR